VVAEAALAENKRSVERLWQALYRKDWDGVAACLAEDCRYEDVPTPDPGARGPANVVRRLRIGLDHVERFEHHFHRMVAEGDTVVFEHTEVWHFASGEVMRNPFVTIHELAGGKIRLWRDYWDLNTLMAAVPKWWIEAIARHSAAEFGAG
jgi:ketosteroid isomerase-like protein